MGKLIEKGNTGRDDLEVGRWEKDLNLVAKAGYSYGHTSYIESLSGKQFFLVDAVKGGGPKIAVIKPSMSEAVQELMRLLNIKIENDE